MNLLEVVIEATAGEILALAEVAAEVFPAQVDVVMHAEVLLQRELLAAHLALELLPPGVGSAQQLQSHCPS